MLRTGPKAITSATSIREAERRAEMLRLRCQGLTLEQIGDEMGVGKDTVQRVIARALAATVRGPANELLALELARCDELITEAMETVRAFHPLIAGGCVVIAPVLDDNGQPVINPETGEISTRVLEDKAPKLAAISTAVRVMERRARLLGLDAPLRTQQAIQVTTRSDQDLSHLSVEELEGIKAKLYGQQVTQQGVVLRLQEEKTTQ